MCISGKGNKIHFRLGHQALLYRERKFVHTYLVGKLSNNGSHKLAQQSYSIYNTQHAVTFRALKP